MPEQTLKKTKTQGRETSSFISNTDELIRPYVREAALVNLSPHLKEEQAENIGNILVESWDDWYAEYVELLTKDIQLVSSKLHSKPEDHPKESWEGFTKQVDFPNFTYIGDKRSIYGFKLCASLCLVGRVKLFCRVGMDENSELYGVNLNTLPEVNRLFHDITSKSCIWLFEKLEKVVKSLYPNIKISNQGSLEVSSFGTRDEALKEFFDKITDENTPLKELVDRLQISEKLSRYFDTIFDNNKILQQYMFSKESAGSEWFTSPSFVETLKGKKELREVLYLAKSEGSRDRVIGLRYDDSNRGVLPRESALEVAKWLGARM